MAEGVVLTVDKRPSLLALDRNALRGVGAIHDVAVVGGRWRDHHLHQPAGD